MDPHANAAALSIELSNRAKVIKDQGNRIATLLVSAANAEAHIADLQLANSDLATQLERRNAEASITREALAKLDTEWKDTAVMLAVACSMLRYLRDRDDTGDFYEGTPEKHVQMIDALCSLPLTDKEIERMTTNATPGFPPFPNVV